MFDESLLMSAIHSINTNVTVLNNSFSTLLQLPIQIYLAVDFNISLRQSEAFVVLLLAKNGSLNSLLTSFWHSFKIAMSVIQEAIAQIIFHAFKFQTIQLGETLSI